MKKGILNKILAASLVSVMALGLMGCGGNSTSDTDSQKDMLEVIQEKGEVVVGMSADYAPYEFHILENGEDKVVGFDVDIAKEIASDLGVELKIQEMDFDALVGALPAGKVDLVISGMNPDEERRKAVDFSDIYYVSSHGILVRKEDKDKYKNIEDLNGLKIGVQLGSTQEKIAQEKVEGAKLTQLANVNNLILELKSGKVDALIIETPVAEMAIGSNPDLVVGDVKFEEESGGNAVGIKKGSPKLVAEVNKTINRLIDDGTLDKYIVDAINLSDKEVKQ
ncbi:transporter substrate-binding domain-containing protein [Clostridium sp.]|uniref:transporter substrate-binding domain-containing protein n=1 Tax=Clostridium sp. TaxID=1506 RepID=UPI003F2DA630